MKEKKSRKEWIKTVAIIFLSVLLVLTFFSNTIKNFSLPEVAVQYAGADTITNKVRGTGTVESSDPYSVIFKAARKIDSVKVRVGDEVEKGDLLFTLEEDESQELLDAKKALKKAQDAYDLAVLSEMISSAVTDKVESGSMNSVKVDQAAIAAAKADVEKYTKALADAEAAMSAYNDAPEAANELKKKLAEAEDWLGKWKTQDGINEDSLSKASEGYNNSLELKILNELKAIQKSNLEVSGDAIIEEVKKNLANSDEKIKTAIGEASTIDDAIKNAQDFLEKSEVKAELVEAQTAKNTSVNKIVEYTNLVNSYTSQEYQLKLNVTNAQTALDKANKKLESLVKNITTQYSLDSMLDSINEAQELVDRLEKEQGTNEIVAPVSGTILAVNYAAGETIDVSREVASIQIAGKGYTLSFSVPNQKAALLSLGDEAEVTNSWWYSDVHARVIAIKPDKNNPTKDKLITFELEGDVQNGQELTLSAGRRSGNYDAVVPNSAIREDNKGKFVYIITNKPTPLGTRYIVEKVEVSVLASDDNKSAVSGIESWTYVVTTSSKPIENGTEVRLKD